jgi:hypothetical protein
MESNASHLFLITIDTTTESTHRKLAPSLLSLKLDAGRRVLRNTYLVKTSQDLDTLAQSLSKVLEPRDEDFIVVAFNKEQCEGLISPEDWDWLDDL